MHKVQASNNSYLFSEDSSSVENSSKKKRKQSTSLNSSLHSNSFKNRAAIRWSDMAQKIKGSASEDNTTKLSLPRKDVGRRLTLSNIAVKVMNLNNPESAVNKEVKRLQKLQAKLERQETMKFEEAREIARRLQQQKMLKSVNEEGQRQYKKISIFTIHGRRLRPIERFQKIVRLLCFLLKIKTSTNRKYKQEQHTGVFEQLDELTETVVNDDGMVFDPNYFKAVKEIKLSQDAVQILCMEPGTRTEEQLQAALAGLKASVSAFGEYPLKMQRRLVTVGWYESFEAKRVIIRQGHRAENFYFILSGTALVTLLINDSTTGEERSTTVAVLGKGSSFGELALLHHKTRSATVLCRNECALLAVGREDFRDIFMSYEDGKEPEHIQFLRNIPYIKDLPLDQCSTRPDVCIFHYFRRGVVIVKNSKSEWVYIIKSGSCRVLTNLVKRKTSLQTSKSNKSIYSLPAIPVDEHERRKLLYTASGDRLADRCGWYPDTKRPRTEPLTKNLTLPAITTTDAQDKFQKTIKKVNFALPWIERLNQCNGQKEVDAHREKIQILHRKLTTSSKTKNVAPVNKNTEKTEHVCVQIDLIKPKDQFGLSPLLYDNEAVKCHLVSNGAECVLIKKSWFLQNVDEAMMRDLRAQIPPYPTQEKLEQRFHDQENWESFKSQTINDLLDTLQL